MNKRCRGIEESVGTRCPLSAINKTGDDDYLCPPEPCQAINRMASLVSDAPVRPGRRGEDQKRDQTSQTATQPVHSRSGAQAPGRVHGPLHMRGLLKEKPVQLLSNSRSSLLKLAQIQTIVCSTLKQSLIQWNMLSKHKGFYSHFYCITRMSVSFMHKRASIRAEIESRRHNIRVIMLLQFRTVQRIKLLCVLICVDVCVLVYVL